MLGGELLLEVGGQDVGWEFSGVRWSVSKIVEHGRLKVVGLHRGVV